MSTKTEESWACITCWQLGRRGHLGHLDLRAQEAPERWSSEPHLESTNHLPDVPSDMGDMHRRGLASRRQGCSRYRPRKASGKQPHGYGY